MKLALDDGILAAGAAALATNLTLVSAIASKAENRTTLLAVRPLIVPVLLVLIDLSENAIKLDIGLARSFYLLGGIVLVLTAVGHPLPVRLARLIFVQARFIDRTPVLYESREPYNQICPTKIKNYTIAL